MTDTTVGEKIERLLDTGFTFLVKRSSERQDKRPYQICMPLGLGMRQNIYSGKTLSDALDAALAKVDGGGV